MAQTAQDPADRDAVERIERMLQATAGEDPALRATLVNALGARQRAVDTLWLWVVGGLLSLAALALLGVLYLLARGNANTPPQLAFAAFMGIFGGLLGLLIGAPWRGPSASG
jgi:ferric-dicitrate binding protein FerR (iron transport regulator)